MANVTLIDKEELREVMSEMMLPYLQQLQQQVKAATAQPESELMTRKEAAAYLKITLVTLNAWTRQGIIKSRPICGRVYYFRSELQALLR